MTTGEFAEAAKTYCLLMDGSSTSFGRTVTHNHDVGGVKFSAHRFWLGLDVVYDVMVSEADRIETAKRLNLKLIVENDDKGVFTHDHLQPLDWVAG